jgi:septal ring factor EnvC (AmiA/AmiB activator)
LAATEKALSEVEAKLNTSQETIKSLETDKVAECFVVAFMLQPTVCPKRHDGWNCMLGLWQAAAEKEIAKLNDELKDLSAANKNLEKAQKQLQAAQKQLQERADSSEASVKSISTKLRAAEAAAAEGKSALAAVREAASSGH